MCDIDRPCAPSLTIFSVKSPGGRVNPTRMWSAGALFGSWTESATPPTLVSSTTDRVGSYIPPISLWPGPRVERVPDTETHPTGSPALQDGACRMGFDMRSTLYLYNVHTYRRK